jgi:hypothetical protein
MSHNSSSEVLYKDKNEKMEGKKEIEGWEVKNSLLRS